MRNYVRNPSAAFIDMVPPEWETMRQAVLAYTKANVGLPAVTTRWQGLKIGEWLALQNRYRQRGNLSFAQIELLALIKGSEDYGPEGQIASKNLHYDLRRTIENENSDGGQFHGGHGVHPTKTVPYRPLSGKPVAKRVTPPARDPAKLPPTWNPLANIPDDPEPSFGPASVSPGSRVDAVLRELQSEETTAPPPIGDTPTQPGPEHTTTDKDTPMTNTAEDRNEIRGLDVLADINTFYSERGRLPTKKERFRAGASQTLVGQWISYQRKNFREGKIHPGMLTALEATQWWNNGATPKQIANLEKKTEPRASAGTVPAPVRTVWDGLKTTEREVPGSVHRDAAAPEGCPAEIAALKRFIEENHLEDAAAYIATGKVFTVGAEWNQLKVEESLARLGSMPGYRFECLQFGMVTRTRIKVTLPIADIAAFRELTAAARGYTITIDSVR